jgi:hypothetical protein
VIRRLPACTALLVTLVLVGLGQAGPASAAAVAPTAKPFGASIDGYPTWQRESTCSPTEKPGPRYLRRLLLATYGPVGSNIVRPCTGADSGHEEGRALDWMTNVRVPAQKAKADAFVAWLQAPDGFGNPAAMARRLGISYVIWNNRTWRAYDLARGWTNYNGCATKKKLKKRAYDNSCHRTHVHISFSWDGALKRTSYYSGFVACPAPLPVPPVPPVGDVPDLPVPVPVPVPGVTPVTGPVLPLPPARLLTTKVGTGTVAGPCRVHPDVRLDLPVLGRGGVPAEGVSAVVLRVELRAPDAAATLQVWPAGAARPLETVPLDVTGRLAQVTVPVGTAGSVSLQLGGAMAHLRADVVGYVPAPVV